MKKVETFGVIYYEINLGDISIFSFDSQELIVRMATMNLSLN